MTRALLTGLQRETPLAQEFRERLDHIAAQGDGHRAVKAARDEAGNLAVPAFAERSNASPRERMPR